MPNGSLPHALVVDDHDSTRSILADLARREGFTVSEAETVHRARAEVRHKAPDLVLLDLHLPDGTGMAVLDDLERVPGAAVVFITGHASVETAIEALRRGVTDYLTKPLDFKRLRSVIGDVARTSGLAAELTAMQAQVEDLGRFDGLVGASKPMRRVYELISRVAPSGATVIVTGESGTGKEVVARTIHDLSRRRHGPFEAVNCGAISPALMESELFGHERGSFTGADRRHTGCFERANRGTIFLDEICEMPVELQVKLLRVLETGSLTRVGGESAMDADVRVIAATNRDVLEAVEQGKLREDLYYRLKVFQINLPPLRDRVDDIELLAGHFLEGIEKTEGTRKSVDESALRALREYSWPGNVRELRNVVHSAHILAAGEAISECCLPSEILRNEPRPGFDGQSVSIPIGTSMPEVERRMILATLAHLDGNKTRTAKMLGISLKTIYNRLHSYRRPPAG